MCLVGGMQNEKI